MQPAGGDQQATDTVYLDVEASREAARLQACKQLRGSFVTTLDADLDVVKVSLHELGAMPDDDARKQVLDALAHQRCSYAVKVLDSGQLLVIQEQEVYVRLHDPASAVAPEIAQAHAAVQPSTAGSNLVAVYLELSSTATNPSKPEQPSLKGEFQLPQSHAIIDVRRAPYHVMYLEQGKASKGIVICSNRDDADPEQYFFPRKAMFDTGANLVLIDERAAKAANLKIESTRGPVTGSLGSQGFSVGIARGVPITVAKGMSWSATVRVDMKVARGVHDLYDVLLGTPFICQLGAFADPIRQRMFYRPLLTKFFNEQALGQVHFIPLQRDASQLSGSMAVASCYLDRSHLMVMEEQADGEESDGDFESHFVCGGNYDGSW
jgi:hypothetical protein